MKWHIMIWKVIMSCRTMNKIIQIYGTKHNLVIGQENVGHCQHWGVNLILSLPCMTTYIVWCDAMCDQFFSR